MYGADYIVGDTFAFLCAGQGALAGPNIGDVAANTTGTEPFTIAGIDRDAGNPHHSGATIFGL